MIEYTVCCDECGRIMDSSRQSVAAARARVKNQGIGIRRGKKDICIHCDPEAVVNRPH